MTTCRECRRTVSSEAEGCPHCGAVEPGRRTDEELAAETERQQASDQFARRVGRTLALIFASLVLFIVIGVIYDQATEVELDGAGKSACRAVEYIDVISQLPNRQAEIAATRLEAEEFARRSDVEGLRRAAAGEDSYFSVAAWCEASNINGLD